MKKTLCVIDGDIVLYQCCSAVEKEIDWGGDWWTLHSDFMEVRMMLDVMLDDLKTTVGASKSLICLSDSGNFRKSILPSYKANRVGGRKPMCYVPAKEYLISNYEVMIEPGLEADDCVSIVATGPRSKHRRCSRVVMISEDKDFLGVPGLLYNPRTGQMSSTSVEDADMHHLFQTLTGDATDNYKGCPGIGPVKARESLEKDPSWSTVVSLYEKAGLSEEDALVQARVARLLRHQDYNSRTKEIKPWNPPTKSTTPPSRTPEPESLSAPGPIGTADPARAAMT